ncbi:M-phase phosphoprotein 6 [Corchorus capsularis]|uniref:M-phase phosphoprotein 6 n=2 Tax=Corchorus TaxID=93758 RepID=A0A1R3GVI8_COCAP|nr:M-phase phosphoprotein 6 [Corchorus capsularis]OMO91197.1 M-phase phosphoprotein 6 [Corchorus olitorius]
MAKRELSSTLRGLKFMQRAAQKEEKVKKEEEVKPEGTSTITRRCVVIMEGDPHPGAVVGRMSFQSFNPSIDKLKEEESNSCQPDPSGGRTLSSENGSASEGAEGSKVGTDKHEGNGDLKRKQSDTASEPQYPNKSPKNGHEVQSSPSSSKSSSKKQSKREKLDWNVLRPPKSKR